MKNRYKYLSMALLAGMAFTSCEDYLDSESKSSYTEKVVFANPSLAEDAATRNGRTGSTLMVRK